jgi:outer membrane protein TolC
MEVVMKIVFLLLFSVLLFSSEKLSINEALEKLKADNLEIKSAQLDIQSASAKIDSVSGLNWGKLDFMQDFANSDDAGNVFGFKISSRKATFNDFGFTQFGKITNDTPPSDLNYPEAKNYYKSKLKYEIPLFVGFKISSYKSVMKSMKNISSLKKDAIINEKVYEIKKSFYDMALLRKSEKLLNTILSNIDTLESTTQSMIEVGYAKKVDILEVRAKKGNVQRLIHEIQLNQKLLLHYISFLLNQKITDIITPEIDVIMPKFNNEEILQSNLDIKQASQGLKIHKHMISAEQSAYYPTIGAFGEISTADESFLGEASDHKSYTVGARLTWNIFNGGQDSANVEKSRVEHLKMKNQFALAKSGISLKVKKIRTQIQTYTQDIISLEKELELADEIYKNYEGRYKEKLSSMSDVIIKQSSVIQKILELQTAHNKRNERIFALVKLANGDL